MKSKLFFGALIIPLWAVQAQDCRWQQRVEYTIKASLNVKTHQVKGDQQIIYYNNSPDTLRRIYYHLYFNAFQPGSMMDVRARNLTDPDGRVMNRISKLKEHEVGYQHIISLKQQDHKVSYSIHGTTMEVMLNKEIMPHESAAFNMQFESQVPVQIRRSGRDNKEGIAYSMTQWYPKIAEYDYQGWHIDPYVGREFFGVWGSYDVTLILDSDYTVAGTGILQNANEIGYGYADTNLKKKKGKQTTWHFVAHHVHDFAWAADPNYQHTRVQVTNGPTIHFFYRPGKLTTENWKKLEKYAVKHVQYMNANYGQYPYSSYSIIQGGDGGMEYPMCTLITGERSLKSLVGVVAHEMSHSWYQGVLGSNESLYPWMDEGFTTFVSDESMAYLFNSTDAPHQQDYLNYVNLVKSGQQEPLSTHADSYHTNRAYGVAAYSMGALFLQQLKYLIGNNNFYAGMKKYYNTWKMKHPEPNDFVRVMEKESGLQLHWYLRYWIYSTKHIDYKIDGVEQATERETQIMLRRIGKFPMPIDLLITYKDGGQDLFYIPMNNLMGNKPVEDSLVTRKIAKIWNWVEPIYTLSIKRKTTDIKSVEIDPTRRMADIDLKNNKVEMDSK